MEFSGSVVVSIGEDDKVSGWLWYEHFLGGGRVDVDEEA